MYVYIKGIFIQLNSVMTPFLCLYKRMLLLPRSTVVVHSKEIFGTTECLTL
jgi:hypothetical protein